MGLEDAEAVGQRGRRLPDGLGESAADIAGVYVEVIGIFGGDAHHHRTTGREILRLQDDIHRVVGGNVNVRRS